MTGLHRPVIVVPDYWIAVAVAVATVAVTIVLRSLLR